MPAPASSSARPASEFCSWNDGPTICNPIGNPAELRPHGILSAGNPSDVDAAHEPRGGEANVFVLAAELHVVSPIAGPAPGWRE